jgi:sRNA-binding protein
MRSSPTGGADVIQGAHLRDAAYRAALIRYSAGSPILHKVLSDLSLLGDLDIRSITSLSELEEAYTRAQCLQRKERANRVRHAQDQERRKRKLEKDKDKEVDMDMDADVDPICALLSPLSDVSG